MYAWGANEYGQLGIGTTVNAFVPDYLSGFRTWTTTQGTLYAWHPSKSGLKALLEDDFVPEDEEGPWL